MDELTAPCGDGGKLPALPMEEERAGAPLQSESPHRQLLQERLRLRLRHAAHLHRHEPHRRQRRPPRRRRRLVAPHPHGGAHALLDLWLDPEPLDLGRHVGVRAHGVQRLQQGHGGAQCLQQVRRERQLAAVTAAVHGDNQLGAKAPDQVKHGRHCGGVDRADGKVDGNGVGGGGNGKKGGEVGGVEVEGGEAEGDGEVGGEGGEGVVDELQLERVMGGGGGGDVEGGDLEGDAGVAVGEVMHEGGPLLADTDVEVEEVDAGGGGCELVEDGLDAGEVGEVEQRGEVGEGLVGGELEEEVVRVRLVEGRGRCRGGGGVVVGDEGSAQGVLEIQGGAE